MLFRRVNIKVGGRGYRGIRQLTCRRSVATGGRVEKVRLGIVGVGNVAMLSVPGYLAHPLCDVVALCDPDVDRARALASAWEVADVFSSLDDLINSEAVDAVEILTPTHLHAQHVIQAVQAAKHVSCQKPIAASVGDARSMIEATSSSKTLFRVAENCCYYPPLVRAKELIAQGAIGQPTVVRIKTVVGETDSRFQAQLNPEGYLWRLDARSPGGHLFDDVMHKYAMAIWLVDEDVAAVQAIVRKGKLYFEAPTVALLEYERPDLLGIMEVAHAPGMFIDSDWYGADEFFEIQGTDGFVWVTRLSGRLHDLPPLIVRSGKTTTYVSDLDDRYEAGFDHCAEAFVEGVLSGEQVDLAPVTALKSLQLAFATYLSSNWTRRVAISDIDGAASPSWWPKHPDELIEDAVALGYLPSDEPPPAVARMLLSQDSGDP
jgi:predicted dehydrogenase